MSVKVKSITVSNLKALSSFSATFDGCTAIIVGKNDGGKSSFLKTLPDRCRGIKPPVILKTGTDEGFKTMEFTDGSKMHYSFNNKTAKGEMLHFITQGENGKEIKGSITKEIANRYFPASFDIDEFLLSTPQKQRKILQGLVGLDFTQIDDRFKVAYEERTYANKKLADAKANLKPIDEKLSTQLADTKPIEEEIYGITHHNNAHKKASDGVANIKKQITDNDTEIKRIKTLLKAAEDKKKDLEKRQKEGEAWLLVEENQPKTDDYSFNLNQKLQKVIDNNAIITKNNAAIKIREDVLALDLEAKAKDKAVKEIEAEKTEMIRGANMPDGFDFSDEGILYKGLPVDKAQISSSDIYIAALKLASMCVGEVRTLYFDASYLDKFKLQAIEDWAQANDLQLLIEKADFEGGEVQYHLLENIV